MTWTSTKSGNMSCKNLRALRAFNSHLQYKMTIATLSSHVVDQVRICGRGMHAAHLHYGGLTMVFRFATCRKAGWTCIYCKPQVPRMCTSKPLQATVSEEVSCTGLSDIKWHSIKVLFSDHPAVEPFLREHTGTRSIDVILIKLSSRSRSHPTTTWRTKSARLSGDLGP